jgi:hypothetical protein
MILHQTTKLLYLDLHVAMIKFIYSSNKIDLHQKTGKI